MEFESQKYMLTQAEFNDASAKLQDTFASSYTPCMDSYLYHQGIEESYLHIKRSLEYEGATRLPSVHTEELEEVVMEEDDNDALVLSTTQPTSRGIKVEYDILFSRTYRVPVLYFCMHHLSGGTPLSLDAVFHYLVPGTLSKELREFGIMGGISITNHPITDIPCFFVHPCNTVEAMTEIIGTRILSSVQYLQTWIGLVGASVGLNLPIELAAKINHL